MVKLLKELDLKNKIEEELYSEMAKRGYWKDKEPFMDWGYYDDKDIVEIDLNEFIRYFTKKNRYFQQSLSFQVVLEKVKIFHLFQITLIQFQFFDKLKSQLDFFPPFSINASVYFSFLLFS